MKINVEFFRTAKADFISNLQRRKIINYQQLNSELSLYCACTGLPVAVAIIFVLEEPEFADYKPQLELKMKVVREFYGYE